MNQYYRVHAVIDLDAICHNIREVKRVVGEGVKVMPVIKADGYGHGAVPIAKELNKIGVDAFAVAILEEGITLRNNGIRQPILILGYTSEYQYSSLIQYEIEPTVFCYEMAESLSKIAQALGKDAKIHIKLDTGMTRVGFQTDDENFEESLKEIIEVSKMPNIHITGIFTHHAVADAYQGDNPAFTDMQFHRFMKMTDALKEAGVDIGLRHCANSATIISYPEKHLDMCRSGIITYGMLPSDECEGRIDLKPLMTLKTTIGLVKHVPAGSQLSYGRTYTAETDRVIATVPIGYADGYNRNLSNDARMLVNGKFAPVVGRICMDQCMLDVTDIPDVKMGDEVVVFGKQGDEVLPIEELANKLHTINYELTCVITKRVPRVYLEGGKIVGIVDHVLHRYK